VSVVALLIAASALAFATWCAFGAARAHNIAEHHCWTVAYLLHQIGAAERELDAGAPQQARQELERAEAEAKVRLKVTR
jgi:hypothetical protein